MTQTTSPRQPDPPGPPVVSRALPGQRPDGGQGPSDRPAVPSSSRRLAAVRTAFEGTPGRLRLVGIGAVLACLMLSLLGSAAFSTRQNALAEARADAAQLIRVQEIATQLVKADSLFTNGYLSFGRESTQNLADYDAAVSEASSLVAESSRANGDDATELAKVNDALSEYTARVASTRANNRQGYQVATGYLRQASDLLRGNPPAHVTGMLPILQDLMEANLQRVDDAYSRSRGATWMLLGTVLLALGGLVAVQLRLARMTHRYVNLPLLGASVAVLLILGVGAVVMVSAQSSANRVYDNSYRALQNLAGARIDAYTAKSAESISLIYRGTGGDYSVPDKQYDELTVSAKNRLNSISGVVAGRDGTEDLAAWTRVHGEVMKASDVDWIAATEAATSDLEGTLNATFRQFDQASSDVLKNQAGGVDSGLATGRLSLMLLTWAAVLAGVLAAVAAWAGISQRLEEYR